MDRGLGTMRVDIHFRWSSSSLRDALPGIIDGVMAAPLSPGVDERDIAVTLLSPMSKVVRQFRLPTLIKDVDLVVEAIEQSSVASVGLGILSRPLAGWGLHLGCHYEDGALTDNADLSLKIPTPARIDEELSQSVASFLAYCCRTLEVTAGGAVGEEDLEYGCYTLAASLDPSAATFSGELVLDYSWQLVLPPQVLDKIDFDNLAELALDYERVLGPGGSHWVVARLASDPELVDPEVWQAWRTVLAPALEPHAGERRVLPSRPRHILECDWLEMSPAEVRKALGLE